MLAVSKRTAFILTAVLAVALLASAVCAMLWWRQCHATPVLVTTESSENTAGHHPEGIGAHAEVEMVRNDVVESPRVMLAVPIEPARIQALRPDMASIEAARMAYPLRLKSGAQLHGRVGQTLVLEVMTRPQAAIDFSVIDNASLLALRCNDTCAVKGHEGSGHDGRSGVGTANESGTASMQIDLRSAGSARLVIKDRYADQTLDCTLTITP